jgi:hypothetical protein
MKTIDKSILKSLLFSSLLMFSFACKSKKDIPPVANIDIISSEDIRKQEEEHRMKNCSPILRQSKYSKDFLDIAHIVHAEINGDCINIVLYYSGCQVTKTMLFYEIIKGTNPPEIRLFMRVQDPGECDQLIDKEKSFDLGEIQGFSTGEVVVRLDGYEDEFRYFYSTR